MYDFGNARVRRRVGRVFSNCQLVILDAPGQSFLCSLVGVKAAQQKQSMCVGVDWPGPGETGLLLRRQGDLDFAGDVLRHLALQRQHVTQVALVALRP